MENDRRFMRRALALAARGAGHTSPNPMVGAVVVDRGQVIGEGYHRAAGSPHGEVEALQQAGDAARGATLYVPLEPCDHHGSKPPHTTTLISSRVERVVTDMTDPAPQVDRHGIASQRAAGLRAKEGRRSAQAGRMQAN